MRSEVDIWIAQPESIDEPELFQWYEELLDCDERGRYQSFRFLEDSRDYLVAHALLRTTLSRYTGHLPQELRFPRTEFGRPTIASGSNPHKLDFNLSHTRGLTACAVSKSGKVGVDVESLDGAFDTLDLSDRVLSDSEQSHLVSLGAKSAKHKYIMEQWCLKEAYTKAVGVGITTDIHLLSFYRDDTDTICLKTEHCKGEEWRFLLHWPSPTYCLAAAASLPGMERLRFRILSVVPGRKPTHLREISVACGTSSRANGGGGASA